MPAVRRSTRSRHIAGDHHHAKPQAQLSSRGLDVLAASHAGLAATEAHFM